MADPDRYRNVNILAPMVRIGTLPTRLLSLRYGADLVYTEELIDLKLLKSERKVNDALGTIDYVDPSDGSVIFRTCSEEKSKLVMQIGTCCPERALQVGKLVENDVSGIDVNMGCPKEFSLKGGMGAALLQNPSTAEAILRSLVRGVRIPVTCKIRVLDTLEETIELCQRFEATGISAIAVHGRKISERPQHANRTDFIQKISEVLKIPVIANGGSKEIESYSGLMKFREESGCSSVMVARAAEWNASVFRREGPLPREEVIKEYLRLAVDYNNNTCNTKYNVQNILRELQESPLGKLTIQAQTLQQICDVWGVGEYCTQVRGTRAGCRGWFVRRLYTDPQELPKTRLRKHCILNQLPLPSYQTHLEDKLFRSTVTIGSNTYTSTHWEKNKRYAEQGAAILALTSLGVLDKKDLKKYALM